MTELTLATGAVRVNEILSCVGWTLRVIPEADDGAAEHLTASCGHPPQAEAAATPVWTMEVSSAAAEAANGLDLGSC